MPNPFDTDQDGIVCLSSGRVAAEEITKDLLAASKKGKNAVKEFMDQRLLTNSAYIFAPITKKSFSVQEKTKKKSAADKEVLSYFWGTVSYPLARADGSLAKTNNSALMDLLESKVETA